MASRIMMMCAEAVELAALQSVGGVENSITDGCWEDPTPDRETLLDMAIDDCFGECQQESAILGLMRVTRICEKVVDTFEYREW